jgi:hypothetical protein
MRPEHVRRLLLSLKGCHKYSLPPPRLLKFRYLERLIAPIACEDVLSFFDFRWTWIRKTFANRRNRSSLAEVGVPVEVVLKEF